LALSVCGVGLAHLHATGGQARSLVPGAHHSDDVGGGQAAGQQLMTRVTPHVA